MTSTPSAARFALIFGCLCAVLAAALLALSDGRQAAGATFTVTKTVDTADGACDADCSLREAIIAANAAPGPDIVSIPAAGVPYALSIAGQGEDAAATGDLDVSGDVAITGAGAAATVISGGGLDRVLHVLSGTVGISGVRIQGGNLAGDGGGIYNQGTVPSPTARLPATRSRGAPLGRACTTRVR